MGANTGIEWCDHTFNPWIGCTKVSPACDHCYAEVSTPARALSVAWGPHAERRRTSEATWRQPLAWNRKAQREGRRFRVFCASLADVFDNAVSIGWLVDLLDVIRTTPHLDWLLLTKRPQLIRRRLEAALKHLSEGVDRGDLIGWLAMWLSGLPPVNVWLGTTVENQAEADRRIPHLLAMPAETRFLSCEPLLGRVELMPHWLANPTDCEGCDGDGLGGRSRHWCPDGACIYDGPRTRIGWIIAGGESGPQARPAHPDWFRSLRDQCQAAGVPFFFKQWGQWVSVSEVEGAGPHYHFPNGATVRGIGKKAAGATLDGREWREAPGV